MSSSNSNLTSASFHLFNRFRVLYYMHIYTLCRLCVICQNMSYCTLGAHYFNLNTTTFLFSYTSQLIPFSPFMWKWGTRCSLLVIIKFCTCFAFTHWAQLHAIQSLSENVEVFPRMIKRIKINWSFSPLLSLLLNSSKQAVI